MSTTRTCLAVRGIDVEVTYKEIKNLHIGVYPPNGKVRVSAPVRLDQEQVRLAVIQRLPWIKRHQRQFRDAARQSPREMVTGESHYVWGIRYRLKVTERPGRAHVFLDGSRLHMTCPPGSTRESRLRHLENWRRSELRERLQTLIDKWEPVIGQKVAYWNIRKMKTRWGSCNPDSGRIWFNLDLAQKHPRCVEYIVVHEMAHLLERHHNDTFVTLLDNFLSNWRLTRDELNSAPLGHEDWNHEHLD